MKRSFLNKLLTGIIGILLFTLIVQTLLQNRFYPAYFKRQVMNNIENIIEDIPTEMTQREALSQIENITTNTGTISTIVYSDDYEDGLTSIPSVIIEDDNGEQFKVFMPRIPNNLPEIGSSVSGSFFKSISGTFYVPTRLIINDTTVYGQRNQLLAKQLEVFEDIIDTSRKYMLEGELLDYSIVNLTNTNDVLLNQELINITTTNTYDTLELSNGYRYVSRDVEGNDENLVYLTQVIIDGEPQIILTIYPLSNIEYITSQMSRFNIFILGVAATFILISITVFSRRVGKPLTQINEATKNFANFEFNTIPEYDSDDEIGSLSKNINKLSTSLQSTLTELQEKNQALSSSLELESSREQIRKDFVEGISHELKTPLAVIQATNEALSLGLIPENEVNEFFETIKKEVGKSNRIIQDMMSVYQIDQADFKANWSTFNMKEMISQSLESHQVLAAAKNLTISSTILDGEIKGDYDKLTLVVNNLLSNAVKYAPQDTEIIIKSSDGYFEISNVGMIPDESISSIFEPFYRVDKARARQDGSTGLGLYIVKQILTQHEAEYDVKSEHNRVTLSFKLKRLI